MKNLLYLLLLLSLSTFAQDTLRVHMKNGEKHYFPVDKIDSLTFSQSTQNIEIYSVHGKVEKGPFLNGSSLTVSELSPSLVQTGKSFETQISNNQGRFSLDQMVLDYPFILLKANGYYFNEVIGRNSTSPITLYALSNLTDGQTINVNILSHLEKDRVWYLANRGMTYKAAKSKARKELLKVFSLDDYNIDIPESLNISSKGESNAILLAVSVILQGSRSEAELSQLLADISSDLKQDGILDNMELGNKLINQSKYLNLPQIRTNLNTFYNSLSVNAEIPDFEKYVVHFLENTEFEYSNFIQYPEIGIHGANVLNMENDTFYMRKHYSFCAELPKATSLKVVLKGSIWGIQIMPEGPINWHHNVYANRQQTFTATLPGSKSDLKIIFDEDHHFFSNDSTGNSEIPVSSTNNIIFEYYENDSEAPTITRIVHFLKP